MGTDLMTAFRRSRLGRFRLLVRALQVFDGLTGPVESGAAMDQDRLRELSEDLLDLCHLSVAQRRGGMVLRRNMPHDEPFGPVVLQQPAWQTCVEAQLVIRQQAQN